MMSRVKIKIYGTWYDALMEKIYHDNKALRKFILVRPLDLHVLTALRRNCFTEVECEDGHKSEIYVADKDVLIEKDWH